MKELSTRRPKIQKESSELCNVCKVQDYGMCPNLIALHDSGYIDPPVKQCAWKDFFDKSYEDMKSAAKHSVKWGSKKK